MATIKQVGPGRKTNGTIDGITYVTRNGKTYARSAPIMPAKVFTTPAALKRQAIFKLVQMHLKFHLRTIRQTFSGKGNGSAINRYYSVNGKAFTQALDALADRYVAGEFITLSDVEAAISTFAAANPQAITIGKLNGYAEVYLTGEWPSTITLNANGGDSTVIIIVAENGATTTITPSEGGSTTVVTGGESGSGSGSGSSTGSDPSTGSGQAQTVEAPTISGTTPFEETTEVTISGPAQAAIYYTVDGSTPTHSTGSGQANGQLYTEPITLTETTTVKAIAIKDGVSSSVATHTFTKGTGGGGLQGED